MESQTEMVRSIGPHRASMGPRPEGHGESTIARAVGGRKYFTLQWGHVQKDMERRLKKRQKKGGLFAASMGPRPEGHGEVILTM